MTLAMALVAGARPARAQGTTSTGIGVGAEAMLTGNFDIGGIPAGLVGPAVVYQAPKFHIDGILNFASGNDVTAVGAGGRFFYQLHSTQASDFSIGGGLGLVNVDAGAAGSTTDIHLEVGAQIRAFLAPAFAVNASVGLGFLLDNEKISQLSGQLVGGAGVTYFFF